MSAVRFTVTKAEDNPLGESSTDDKPNYGTAGGDATPAVKIEDPTINGRVIKSCCQHKNMALSVSHEALLNTHMHMANMNHFLGSSLHVFFVAVH